MVQCWATKPKWMVQSRFAELENHRGGCYIFGGDSPRVEKREYGYALPLLAACIIWGTSFVAGKVGVENVDPVLFSLLRYGFAALSALPIIFLFKEFDWTVLRSPLIWGISLINAVAMNLQNIGMTMTTVTNAVLLIDINVVYIAVLASFVLKEKLTPRILVGLILGIVGVVIIATNGDVGAVGGGTFMGNMAVLVAGLLWSVYVVYLTKMLKSGTPMVSATFAIISSPPFCLFRSRLCSRRTGP